VGAVAKGWVAWQQFGRVAVQQLGRQVTVVCRFAHWLWAVQGAINVVPAPAPALQ
jgi:hypothetical protein